MIFIECIIFILIGIMIGFLFGKEAGYNPGYESGLVDGFASFEDQYTVKISDELPEKPTKKNVVLKLQNELMNYVEINNGRVEIRVVKKNDNVSDNSSIATEE